MLRGQKNSSISWNVNILLWRIMAEDRVSRYAYYIFTYRQKYGIIDGSSESDWNMAVEFVNSYWYEDFDFWYYLADTCCELKCQARWK